METRKVNVCGVPFEMSIVDGGVLFSNKSGFYGVSARYMWEYRGMLWYLDHIESTFKVPGCHLVRMHELLAKHISGDHTEAGGASFDLKFTPTEASDE
jgi:hypothetical protein